MACLASCCPSPKSSSLRVVAAARCRLAKAPSPAQKPYCQHMAKSDGLLLTQNPLLASLPKEQLLTISWVFVCLIFTAQAWNQKSSLFYILTSGMTGMYHTGSELMFVIIITCTTWNVPF